MTRGPTIPLQAVEPLSERRQRLMDLMKPSPFGWGGRPKSQEELAAICKAAWHKAGYFWVDVWVEGGERGIGLRIVMSNLLPGGLPPMNATEAALRRRPMPVSA